MTTKIINRIEKKIDQIENIQRLLGFDVPFVVEIEKGQKVIN